ncbi:MAG: carboxymuconolactone decarboxylase family protein [Microbacteriaceae bacterium]
MSPRIAPAPEAGNRPDVQQILDRAERLTGGAGNVNRTLARHPGLFRHYAGFVGKLLWAGKLPPRDRELAIMRVAWLCRSAYEWGQHHRIGMDAGLSEHELARVPHRDDPRWNDADRAVLAATDELVTFHRVEQGTWDALRARFDEQQLIELVMCIGAYVMVAGFLNTVGVEPEEDLAPFPTPSNAALDGWPVR